MGGREHYSYRNRTRRICCFLFKESFFFSTSNKLLNKCLKCLKRLEVLLGTFRESTGTEQLAVHSTARLFSEAVPLIRARFSPLLYKRNLRQEKYVENISNAARTELQRMGLEGGGAIPCPAEETELSITPAKKLFSYAG